MLKHEMCVFVCLCCAGCINVLMSLYDGCMQFCQLSRDGEAYHDYCLNYSKAMSYLEQLRKKEDFCEFEKVTIDYVFCRVSHRDDSYDCDKIKESVMQINRFNFVSCFHIFISI